MCIRDRTIAENIAFGLKIKNKSKSYINDKITYALKLVNLEGYGNRMPDSLSGGQQQRIAIARAIVNEPKVLLPVSYTHLDVYKRQPVLLPPGKPVYRLPYKSFPFSYNFLFFC